MPLHSTMLYFLHMDPVRLTREEIKKLVYGLKSLDEDQRELVRETLDRLAHSSDGRISPEELRKELADLRRAYEISEIDADAITSAVFPE